ncbi:MAG: carboxypeptidase regulatory-like domain-containing protein [Desulfobacteraceae bacterium]|nr:carboxypeptidase regulatory-like domain-containing protein [Desulfobacteraceae bacterium]
MVDLVHPYSNAPFPARGAEVTLYVQTQNGPMLVTSYFTGGDGMYYLQNIRPGNYTLVVNRVLRFFITVYNIPLQDLPPILFRY